MCLTSELNTLIDIFYSDCSYLNNIQSATKELINIFKKKSLKRFNQKDIEKYIKILKLKNNSNSTINNKLVFLHKALTYNNNNDLKLPFQKVKNKEKNIITSEQFNYLLNEFQTNKDMYNIIMIAYYTGLRVNEILNIKQQHLIYDDNTYYLNLYNTKNHKDNLIPLSHKLDEIMNNFKEFELNYKQVYYYLKKYNITIHQFRHTFITNCYEKGLDSFSIMRLTNQTSLSVHKRYNHITNKRLKDLIKVL